MDVIDRADDGGRSELFAQQDGDLSADRSDQPDSCPKFIGTKKQQIASSPNELAGKGIRANAIAPARPRPKASPRRA
jgi:hypothetical protein